MTDLRSRLHAVVDGPGAADDVPVDRGATALDDIVVGALTTRIRRRRAVRTGATGALGALTVAAVAVGAAALTDGRGTASVPSGTEQPAPDGVAGLALRCGDVVPAETLQPERHGLTLVAPELANSTVVEGEPVDVTIALAYDGLVGLSWDTEQYLQLAALQDGVVVATGVMPFINGMQPGRYTHEEAVTLAPCPSTGQLPADGYALIASVVFANADATDAVELSAGPVPFTVVPAPATTSERRRQAEAALAEVVAAAESARTDAAVGACGTRMPVDTDPYLGLGIELSPPVRTGEPVYGTGSLSARDGLTVVGDAPITGVQVVLTRDGVVVGRGQYDPDFASRLTVTPGGPLELPAAGDAVVCRLPGTQAPTLPLPPGTYQAYGLYQVAVTDVEAAGDAVPGGGAAVTDTVTGTGTGTRTVVSEPVDVVIEDELG